MKFPKGQTMILYKYTTQKNGLSNTNPTNFGENSCASERQAVPAPLGPPFVLLFLQMLCYFLFFSMEMLNCLFKKKKSGHRSEED
jgi:hypothetical protein